VRLYRAVNGFGSTFFHKKMEERKWQLFFVTFWRPKSNQKGCHDLRRPAQAIPGLLPVCTLHFVSGCEALRALKIVPSGEKELLAHKANFSRMCNVFYLTPAGEG